MLSIEKRTSPAKRVSAKQDGAHGIRATRAIARGTLKEFAEQRREHKDYDKIDVGEMKHGG